MNKHRVWARPLWTVWAESTESDVSIVAEASGRWLGWYEAHYGSGGTVGCLTPLPSQDEALRAALERIPVELERLKVGAGHAAS